MLRVVSPGELETCHCVAVELLVYIPDEDYPRCFECLRPVRQYLKLDNCGRWAYLVWSLMVAHESGEEPSEDLPTAASSAETTAATGAVPKAPGAPSTCEHLSGGLTDGMICASPHPPDCKA